MATTYGLTPEGFVVKPQQVIIDEINASLQNDFGANINLGPESVFGQLVGIFSEREALIWQLAAAVYASQYPAGAEGTSVDNILALNNLQRLPASATVTDPTPTTDVNDITLNGLVLYGVPGTIVPANSLINTTATPPKQFKLNTAVTIGSPANCVQSIFFSSVPDSGNYALSFTRGPKQAGNVFKDVLGSILTTPSIPYDALSDEAQINFSNTPTSGTFKFALTQGGVTVSTAFINWDDTAGQIQTKITALSGYSGVIVSGSINAGLIIAWGSICHPTLAITNNTLSDGGPITAIIKDSVQSYVNNLSEAGVYPFTDVLCTGFTTGLLFTFGAFAALGSNPTNLNQPQPIIKINANSLLTGATVVNLNVVMTTKGNGIGDATSGVTPGAATCTVTGPNFVSAGTLTSIASPVSGWNGVYNELDCRTGTNQENDTEALLRRSTLLAAQANGPLQSIEEKVRKVPGVTKVKAFQNLSNAALQNIIWASIPSSGNYKLRVGAEVTSTLAYNATAAQIQTAVQALSGYDTTLVTGTYEFGFSMNFNGANGNQAVPLFVVESNTTGVSASISFGRAPHSFEVIVEGGEDDLIAQAIYDSAPAGIGSYGSTQYELFDSEGNPVYINFSRPTEIPIYILISLITDQYIIPGDSGSGVNPVAKFNPQSIATIQNDLLDIGALVPIGGLVIGFGSDGLIGAFNNVPGIVNYTMFFGTSPNPTQNVNIQMPAAQVPLFQTFNIIVSYE